MAKLSQAAVKAKADEWAARLAEIAKAERIKIVAIDPIITRHNAELASVQEKHDKRIAKLQAEADALRSEVVGWLEAKGTPIRIEGEKAVAAYETGTSLGPRVISVKQFLESAKSKGEAMYDCINILVQKAEKLLGKKELDQISTRPETPTKSVTLKLKD